MSIEKKIATKTNESIVKPRGLRILYKWYITLSIFGGLFIVLSLMDPNIPKAAFPDGKIWGIFDYDKYIAINAMGVIMLAPIALVFFISKPVWYGRFVIIAYEGFSIAQTVQYNIFEPYSIIGLTLWEWGGLIISILILRYMFKPYVKSYFEQKPSKDEYTVFTDV